MRICIALALVSASAMFAQTPTITAVLDGAAYTSDIAQGSVFVVKGTALSASGFVSGTAPAYPTTLNNVQISLTAVAGGAGVQALMVYTYNLSGVNQLSAVLPSNAAVGAYDLRVLNNGATSVATRVNVVARKPGIVTMGGNGAGPAQATLNGALILDRLTDVGKIGSFDTRPAKPGERVDLWGTGLGADRASDTGGTSGDQTAAANIRVLVAGREIMPLYAGRSQGFPGLDQIVFALPSNIGVGCFVPVQVRAGGVLSNLVTLSIDEISPCLDGIITAAMATKLSLGGTVTSGLFEVESIAVEIPLLGNAFSESIAGNFGTYTADQYAGSNLNSTTGSCTVYKQTGNIDTLALRAASLGLDAGASLTATKSDNGSVTLPKGLGADLIYKAFIDAGSSRVVAPGTFRLAGTGGADVGAFNAQVVVPQFTWTNKAAITAINRSQDLNINWTGGGTGSVGVLGFGGKAVSGSGANAKWGVTIFSCLAWAPTLSLTVPTSILQQLPAAAFNPTSLVNGTDYDIGFLFVYATSDGANGKFTAPLTKGGSIDYGLYSYILGDAKLLSVQ